MPQALTHPAFGLKPRSAWIRSMHVWLVCCFACVPLVLGLCLVLLRL